MIKNTKHRDRVSLNSKRKKYYFFRKKKMSGEHVKNLFSRNMILVDRKGENYEYFDNRERI